MGSVAHRTYDDLLAFPEDDGKRRELFDGVLVVTPAPHARHQLVLSRLDRALGNWAEDSGWTVAVGPVDLVITPRDVLEPDLVALRPDHLYTFEERFIGTPPDLVVEVASPSTRRRDLGAKAATYAAWGVAEYWFVDHQRASVVVHRLAGDAYRHETLIGDATLTSPMLPGFACGVVALCAPPRRQGAS